MRSNLLKSFIYVFGFWWLVVALRFSIGDPAMNLAVLTRLHHVLPFIHFQIPKAATALNAWSMQVQILRNWTLPVVVLTVVSAFIGHGLIYTWQRNKFDERQAREKGSGQFRGITITVGAMPQPVTLKREDIELEFTDAMKAALDKLPKVEYQLLMEILSVLAAYPDAFPGDGHGVTLLEHSLNVLEKMLLMNPDETLAIVAAAAHDIGKITAFEKDKSGNWNRVKMHDKESAKHLALLPGFWALPELRRNALILAVKHDHSEGNMPIVGDGAANKLAKKITDLVHQADGSATKEEKQRVLETHSLPEMALRSFIDTLPTFAFQNPGLPKGVKAVGWKKGNRLYLIEIQIREQCMKRMDPDVRAALGGNYREKTKTAPFTLELLNALEEKGWLIREIDKAKVPVPEAMWKLRAGTKEFQGVIIMDVPQELLDLLPAKDSAYEVTVLGPQFMLPGTMPTSGLDMGDILAETPAPNKKRVKKEEPVEAPAVTEAVAAPAVEVVAAPEAASPETPDATAPVVSEPAPEAPAAEPEAPNAEPPVSPDNPDTPKAESTPAAKPSVNSQQKKPRKKAVEAAPPQNDMFADLFAPEKPEQKEPVVKKEQPAAPQATAKLQLDKESTPPVAEKDAGEKVAAEPTASVPAETAENNVVELKTFRRRPKIQED